VLPCVALAAVTMNLARMTLTTVGILACLLAFAITVSTRNIGVGNNVRLGDGYLVPEVVPVCIYIAAIGVQYASRRTWFARILLLSLPLWILGFMEFVPTNRVDRVYAQQSGDRDGSARLVYSVPENESFPASHRSAKEIDFGVPVAASEPSDATILAVDDVKIAMDADDGTRWVSPWEGSFGIPIGKRGEITLVLPSSVYSSFLGKKISLHLTLAVSEGKTQSSTTIPFPSTDVAIPGDGICSARSTISAASDHTQQSIDTHCRFPLRQPYLRITMQQTGADCHSGGEQWTGTLGDAPADFSIDPVELGANFSTGNSYSYNGLGASLPCPAAGVMLTQYGLERRTELSLTIRNFQLPAMVPESGH
jgi:hypothetical protein